MITSSLDPADAQSLGSGLDIRIQILLAAEQEFAAQGFAAARLEDIAANVGMRRPSLLYHFRSKEQLYSAVMAQAFGAVSALLDEVLNTPGVELAARIEAMVAQVHLFLRNREGVARLLLRDLLDGRGPTRVLVMAEIVPLLMRTERFLRTQHKFMRPDVQLRPALMMIVSDALVRAGAGPMADLLWGEAHPAGLLARQLLLANPGALSLPTTLHPATQVR